MIFAHIFKIILFFNHFGTQLDIVGGSFKESQSTINLSATTSFYQLTQRFEADIFNLKYPYIPIEKQRFHTFLYLGLGVNGFKRYANDLDNNIAIRQAQSIKLATSYGLIFRLKIAENTSFNLDFGHNRIFTDIFDATIGENKRQKNIKVQN